MGRPVVHWELMSKDPEKISSFYEKLFGWKIKNMPEMNYRLVETGSGINGGILKPPRPDPTATHRNKRWPPSAKRLHRPRQGRPW